MKSNLFYGGLENALLQLPTNQKLEEEKKKLLVSLVENLSGVWGILGVLLG